MQDIAEKMSRVNSLAAELCHYWKAHASPENEGLVQVSLLLTAYNLALGKVIGHATFGETEIKGLIEILEPVNASEAEALRRIIPDLALVLPTHRSELRLKYAEHLMGELNAVVDLGRHLLKVRELKDHGMSDQDIKKFSSSWNAANLF